MSVGNKEILSNNLKRYIAMSGKERKDLADDWGIAYSTLSEWLSGKKYPRIDKIQMMADYFGIAMADLIEEGMTEEDEKENDTLVDIIVRLRTDDSLRDLVESICSLDSEKIDGVKKLLDVLNTFSK